MESNNKKSAGYTFTFSHKGFVQTVEITDKDLYLDDKAPEIKSFKIENGSSDSDKLLSFLTFGIYHNNVIKVTVNAEDEDISSGIKDIVLYDGKMQLRVPLVRSKEIRQAEFLHLIAEKMNLNSIC